MVVVLALVLMLAVDGDDADRFKVTGRGMVEVSNTSSTGRKWDSVWWEWQVC